MPDSMCLTCFVHCIEPSFGNFTSSQELQPHQIVSPAAQSVV